MTRPIINPGFLSDSRPAIAHPSSTAARHLLPMIQAVLVFNNKGLPRLTKFYSTTPSPHLQQLLIAEIFTLVSKRPPASCNFLEGSQMLGGDDVRIIYRHYATLFFVFVVDESESELGILDLIQVSRSSECLLMCSQVFVESLDCSFPSVCELDLVRSLQVTDEVKLGRFSIFRNVMLFYLRSFRDRALFLRRMLRKFLMRWMANSIENDPYKPVVQKRLAGEHEANENGFIRIKCLSST